MRSRWTTILCLLTVSLVSLVGCSREPKVKAQSYLASGQRYFDKQEYEKASIEFRNAVQADPSSAEAEYRLARAEAKQEHFPEAHRHLERVILLQPSNVDARLDMAELMLLSNQPKEVHVQLDAVDAIAPDNFRSLELRGRVYATEKDFPNAIEAFERAKKLNPQDPMAWSYAGFAQVGAGHYPAAEADFRQAIQLDPTAVEPYRNLANLFQFTGRVSEIDPLLEQAIQRNPKTLDLYLLRAGFQLLQGQQNQVEAMFDGLRQRQNEFPGLDEALGDFWAAHNQLERAITEYKTSLTVNPTTSARRKLVRSEITLERLADAEQQDQILLKTDPKDLEARGFAAAIRVLRGEPASAIPDFRAVLKEEPQSLFARYYLGMALSATGNKKEAETAFLECTHQNANFGDPYARLAELRLEANDWQTALEYAEKMTAISPQLSSGYILQAQSYLAGGRPRQAEEVLRTAQRIGPLAGPSLELVGATYIAEGRTEEGIRQYEAAWQSEPDRVTGLNRMANDLLRHGQGGRAVSYLQRLTATNPDPAYFETLARVQLSRDDAAAAQLAAEEALHLDGSRPLGHYYLGQAYDGLGRADDARAQFDAVIKLRPQDLPAYIAAGDVCLRQADFAKARSYYQTAKQIAPDDASVQYSLARLSVEQGIELQQAMAVIQELQQRFPDDPNLKDTLAWIYYQQGAYPLAVGLLKQCVKNQPRDAVFQFHLGMTYAKLREADAARQALATALKLGLRSQRWRLAARQTLDSLS